MLKERQGGQERHSRELTAEAISELHQREQKAWQNTLGAHVEVKSLPDYVTPEVRSNLERMGFGLRYIPAIDLSQSAYISVVGIDRYQAALERQYPRWKPYESLYKKQRDHSVPRNLEKWFWHRVSHGDIGIPVLSGQWMAVETVEKPEYGKTYASTPFAERIGFQDDRFSAPWNDVRDAIEREKPKIITDIGLSGMPADIRFLEAIEWNLLGNREGWGKTNTYEWTKTGYRSELDNLGLLVAGNYDEGGAAAVRWSYPNDSYDDVGFRAAVVLDGK
jgi:hypothetical protein